MGYWSRVVFVSLSSSLRFLACCLCRSIIAADTIWMWSAAFCSGGESRARSVLVEMSWARPMERSPERCLLDAFTMRSFGERIL